MNFDIGHAHVLMVKSAGGKPATTHSLSGELYLSKSGWILLQVPNALVNGAFAALDEPGVELPPSGPDKHLNAHISVMRPEELEEAGITGDDIKERGQHFKYTLGPVQEVSPNGWAEMSKVWFIKCNSPELKKLRRTYGMTSLPKDGEFDFHITIGVRRKGVLNVGTRKAASLIHGGDVSEYFSGIGSNLRGREAGLPGGPSQRSLPSGGPAGHVSGQTSWDGSRVKQSDLADAGAGAEPARAVQATTDLGLLARAKERSDVKDYQGKYQVLRMLMQDAPGDFVVDSPVGKYHGITHTPTGYRYHVPPAVYAGLVKMAFGGSAVGALTAATAGAMGGYPGTPEPPVDLDPSVHRLNQMDPDPQGAPGMPEPINSVNYVDRIPDMLETMRPNPLAKPAPASLPAIKRAPARPWDPKRYKPEAKVTPAQHAEYERRSDRLLPTSESLGQQLKAQGYYEKAPGGYQGAMDRAQQAAANDPIANAPIYTQKAIEQEFPVLWERTSYKPGGSVSRQPWRGKDPNGYVNMLVKAQEPYRPLDPGATVPRDTLTQSILEHELTHTAQGNDPGYKPKQNIPLQTGRDPWHAGDQWMNWVEVDPRLAEIKRYYTRSHPGSSVDTPEDAAKAWDWFKSEGYKTHPNPLLKQLDLRVWRTLPKDPAALKKLLLRRMPQLMQNRDPNTFGKTSMLAGTQLAGKLKQASLGYAVRDSDIHGQGTFATRAYEPGDRVGLALQFNQKNELGSREFDRTVLGRFVNYQDEGNVVLQEEDGNLFLHASKPIAEDEEMYTQPYDDELAPFYPMTITTGYKQAFDMSGSWYGDAAQDYGNNLLAGRQPLWDSSKGIMDNITGHMGSIRDVASTRINQAQNWNRFQGAMDPNHSLNQLSSYLSGKRRPIVNHPVDAILHGRFGS